MNTGTPASQVKEVERFFDEESNRYTYERYERQSCEQLAYLFRRDIVVRMARDFHGLTCDLGCGPGVYTALLGGMRLPVLGIDISAAMLKQAKRSMAAVGGAACVLRADSIRLPVASQAAEHVVSIGLLDYIKDLPAFIGEVRRVLKPEGTWIVQFSNRLCPWANVTHGMHAAAGALGVRRYAPYTFDMIARRPGLVKRSLRRHGFTVLEQGAYDFRLPFIEKYAPRLARAWSRMAQPLHDIRGLRWLGEGYVIKAQKRGALISCQSP